MCSEAEVSDWFDEVELPTLSTMLTTVFYQCVECLADPMWELRRMAGQVTDIVLYISFTTFTQFFSIFVRSYIVID